VPAEAEDEDAHGHGDCARHHRDGDRALHDDHDVVDHDHNRIVVDHDVDDVHVHVNIDLDLDLDVDFDVDLYVDHDLTRPEGRLPAPLALLLAAWTTSAA
jgi:hypothetical protein